MFKLLRYFSVTSLLAFLIIGFLLTFLYRQQAVRDIVALEELRHLDITQFLYNDFSEAIQGLLAEPSPENLAIVKEEMGHHLGGSSIYKLEMFDARGRMIFEVEAEGEEHEENHDEVESHAESEHEVYGEDQSDDPDIQKALRGETESELVPLGTLTDEGERSEQNLIASYIPIRAASGGTVIGVFELYSNADSLVAKIQRTQNRLIVTLGSLLAGLYGILLLIVRRGQTILKWQHTQMQQQQTALEQEREQLQLEVTERRRVEAELAEQSENLLRSNKDLETFAYVASHDLQEPLRKVQTFSDRLATKYKDKLDEDGKVYINRMQESLGRMRGLIQDLLTYSRVQNNQQEVAMVDLNEVVRGVISDLEVRLEQSKGRVEVGNLPTVQANPLQMRQVFQNLIGNALKFSKPDLPPIVTISAKQQNNLHEIVVRDNGIGFEQQHAERIFEVFQRLQGRGTYEGTGIGLAIVRKILEQHGGEVRAESEVGQGARFYLTLPVTQQEPARHHRDNREVVRH